MLVEESRIFESPHSAHYIFTEQTGSESGSLRRETIADEVDRQLGETVSGFVWPKEQTEQPSQRTGFSYGLAREEILLSAQN